MRDKDIAIEKQAEELREERRQNEALRQTLMNRNVHLAEYQELKETRPILEERITVLESRASERVALKAANVKLRKENNLLRSGTEGRESGSKELKEANAILLEENTKLQTNIEEKNALLRSSEYGQDRWSLHNAKNVSIGIPVLGPS